MFSALTGLVWYLLGSTEWFVIMLTVLVASCPCALSLATPAAYTIGATVLRKMGVVISNGSFIEKLSIINSIVFDKTGTLTKGNLNITNIILNGSQDELALKKVASALEDSSNHPIASAFSTPGKIAQNVSMHPGNGVSGYVDGVKYYLGHPKFINKDLKKPDKDGLWTVLYSSELLAWFKLEDSLRSDAKTAIKKLHESKLRLALYTGDDSSQGSMIANELGITDFCTSVSTEKKQDLIMRQQKNGFNVMMVGDGINDTAAMAVANTSIAFRPVDSFVHASADAVMLGGGLSNLPKAIHFSKRVNKTIKQNIGWAITYNFSVIPLAASGIIRPWMAALGMSVSSILVVLNSNKLLVNKWK
jgi:Cu2+-exporting ATPase